MDGGGFCHHGRDGGSPWGLPRAVLGSEGCPCRVWGLQHFVRHRTWMLTWGCSGCSSHGIQGEGTELPQLQQQNPPCWGIPDGNKAQQEEQGMPPLYQAEIGHSSWSVTSDVHLGKASRTQLGSPGNVTGPSSSVPKSFLPWARLQPGRLWQGSDFP